MILVYNITVMDKYIIAIGGGEIRQRETLPIDGYICDLVKSRVKDRRANALFVGTASHDYMPYYNTFHKIYTGVYGLKTDCALTVHVETDDEKLKNKFEKADLIYVGGGDTVYMLKKWKERNIYDLILKAYERGAVICGLSAGAICWFEKMYTDGLMTEGVSDNYEITDGLGLLNGGACPHYDDRKDDFANALNDATDGEWFAIGNKAAVVFKGLRFETALSCGGNVFKVEKTPSEIVFKEIFTEKLR